ncbi:MAG: hypothetical protein AAF939_20780, partial [Planctomycetota bacterium]
PIFRTIAFVVALVQMLIGIGFMVGGDFGEPVTFSSTWLLSAMFLLTATMKSKNKPLLTACIVCNLIGLAILWAGYQFFPRWLYGNVLTSHGSHTLFVACASLVSISPTLLCLVWRMRLAQSNVD